MMPWVLFGLITISSFVSVLIVLTLIEFSRKSIQLPFPWGSNCFRQALLVVATVNLISTIGLPFGADFYYVVAFTRCIVLCSLLSALQHTLRIEEFLIRKTRVTDLETTAQTDHNHIIDLESQLILLMDAVPQAIIVEDRDAKILQWSRRAEILFGYTEEEALQMNALMLIPPKIRDERRAAFRDIVSSPIVDTTYEAIAQHKNGRQFPVRVSLASWNSLDDHPLIVATVQDITDEVSRRSQHERQLKILRSTHDELRQYTAAIGHHLRNPLSNAVGLLDLLQRTHPDITSEVADYLAKIRCTLQHTQEVVQDLYHYSEEINDNDEPPTAHLNEVLNELLRQQCANPHKTQAEITRHPDPLPSVPLCHSSAKRVLGSLLENALKFQPPGQIPHIEITATRKSDHWQIAVSDNGLGIRKDHHQRIFELFSRLNSNQHYTGSGTGLAICKKIVERRGGSIWVESELGEGSTFYFTIPLDVPTTGAIH
jgi:PAS domain S-box-containing protein